jgi:hypothetical protein
MRTPSFLGETNFLAETLYHKGLVPHFSFLTLQTGEIGKENNHGKENDGRKS